jgi:hypothetical protein
VYIKFEAFIPTENSFNARFEALRAVLLKMNFSFDVIASWMCREL